MSKNFEPIILNEKFNVSNAQRLICCNKIKPEDRIYLINKLKKYPNGIMQIKYNVDKGFGRFKTNVGDIGDKKFIPYYMIGTKKNIRSFLAKDYYHDLDIENCHPVLISQIAQNINIETPFINEYINNRSKVLDEISKICSTDKNTVKNCFLRLLYGGSPDKWAEDFKIKVDTLPTILKDIQTEILQLTNSICNNKENKNLLDWVLTKKNNKDVSIFAHYVQTEERKCLKSMYDFITSKNYEVGALIHDGLLVEKKSDNIELNFLEECIEYVFNDTGYRVNIVEKEMVIDESLIEGESESYEYIKSNFETNHVKIIYPAIYIKEGDNPYMMTPRQLLDSYSHINYLDFNDGKMTKKNFVSSWTKDDTIRKFDKLDFLPPPLICNDNVYNQWAGFTADKLPPITEDLTKETNEIFEVFKALCGDDDVNWSYFEKWIAQMIQQPGEITGISVLMKSIEGCGKGFICEVLKAIMGDEYYYQSGNAETDVFSRFSNALRFRVLININESRAKTNYDYQDLIKHIITAPSITYEEKGKQSIVIKNCARLLFTTNNDFAMPLSDDERRFVIFESSSKYKGKTEIWNKLFNYIKNPKIIKALYNHFMNINVNDVDWINDRPKTEVYNDLVAYNTPKELRFIIELARKNYSSGFLTVKKSASTLYKEFREYLDNNGLKEYATNTQKLGMQISKYSNLFEKHKSQGIMLYNFDCKVVLEYAVSKNIIDADEVPIFNAPIDGAEDEEIDTNLLDA